MSPNYQIDLKFEPKLPNRSYPNFKPNLIKLQPKQSKAKPDLPIPTAYIKKGFKNFRLGLQ